MLILLVPGVGMGGGATSTTVDEYTFYYHYRRKRSLDHIAKLKALKRKKKPRR